MTGISDGSEGNQIGTPETPINPLLAALGNYGGPTQTIALLPGSPAIGGGTRVGAPATDQRGLERADRVDIGAFQSQGFTFTPVAGSTPQSAALGATFGKSLAVTVTANNSIEPVDGGNVSFAAPTTGASATLSPATMTIAGGQASVTASANGVAGSYAVTASATGAGSVTFSLTNTATFRLVRQPPPQRGANVRRSGQPARGDRLCQLPPRPRRHHVRPRRFRHQASHDQANRRAARAHRPGDHHDPRPGCQAADVQGGRQEPCLRHPRRVVGAGGTDDHRRPRRARGRPAQRRRHPVADPRRDPR
jgi:hypothetical protein